MESRRKMKWAAFLPALFLGFASVSVEAQSLGGTCPAAGWLSLGAGTSNPGYLLYCNGTTWGLAEAITSAGLVGIGTTTPTATLQVSGTSYFQNTMGIGNTGSAALVLQPSSLITPQTLGLVVQASSGATEFSADNSGNGYFAGNVGIGTAGPLSALDVNGGIAIGSYAGNNAAPSNGLIVSGNVGIGTANPTYALTVNGGNAYIQNIATAGKVYFPTNASSIFVGTAANGLQINGGSYGTVFFGSTVEGQITTAGLGIGSVYDINHPPVNVLEASGAASIGSSYVRTAAPSNGLIIQGNVGIGSTSPVSSLDISQKTDALALPSGTVGQRPASGVNGMIRYDSSGTPAIEAYVNGSWISLLTNTGSTSSLTLGTSASATNPQVSGDPTTGFYTAGVGKVDVSISGTQTIEWNSSGTNIVTGSLKLAGNNGIWQDATNYNLAVGPTAFPTTVSQAGGASDGQSNVAVGYLALNTNTTGQHNTAVGVQTLMSNTIGYWNTAIGSQALYANTQGIRNTAIGRQALYTNSTGGYNTALGYQALKVNTTGVNNTAVGHNALVANSTGSNNTALGYNVASATLATGSNNILIGTSAAVDTVAAGTNYNLNIGNLLQGDLTNSTVLGTEALYLQSTASSVNYLQIAGAATTAAPVLAAQGTDTNISINVTPKGTGSTNFTSGNVGIGTTSPVNYLTVVGDGTGVAQLGTAGCGSNYVGLTLSTTATSSSCNNYSFLSGPTDQTLYINRTTGNAIKFRENNNDQVIIAAGGNVGIGTTSPAVALAVTGKAIVGSNNFYNSTAQLHVSGTGQLVLENVGLNTSMIHNNGTNLYFGTDNGGGGFSFRNGVASAGDPATSGTDLFTVAGSGKVGIGSTGPVSSLDISQKTDALALPVGTTGQRPTPVNGMIRYNSTVAQVEASIGGVWTALSGSGGATTITLGTSASATNPQRSGDATTGLFSAATGQVSIASAGTEVGRWISGGLNILGTVTAGSDVPALQINGNNAVWQDATNSNIAVGATAFPTTVSQAGGGTNGQSNTAIGYQALNANTTGYQNTALGYQALNLNTTGTDNNALGAYALQHNTASFNTALGSVALTNNTTGQWNVAVGNAALLYNTTGANNTAIGAGALSINTGTNNTVIGASVASNVLATGSNNILIGTSAAVDTPATGTNYNLNIGNLLQGDMTYSGVRGTEALYLQSTSGSVNYLQIAGAATTAAPVLSAQGSDTNISINVTPKGTGSTNFTSGNVGIGTTTPNTTLQVSGTSYFQDTMGIGNNGSAALVIKPSSLTTPQTLGVVIQNSSGGTQFSADNSGNGYFAGNVGIGTTSPQATLDVNGYARLSLNSSAPVTCSSTNQGAIALNHLAQMCACNGSSWIFSDSTGASCSW